jgi:predicted HTH domain antitoxin
MATVTLEIPDDLLLKLKDESGDASNALRLAAAFFLCRRGELSTSQAARLAGMAYADFLDAAARAKVELFPINDDEIKEEIRVGYTLGRQCVTGHLAVPGGSP